MESALSLFAERGFDGVGVDLIAEKAGLKGPSIYKHFKGKEEILSVLIEQIESYYGENFGSETNLGPLPVSVEELIESALQRISFTIHDERIKKTRRILTMEQFRNPRIAELASMHSLDRVQRMYQKILEGMMDAGILEKTDAQMLSMSFTAPITLLIQMCDRQPEREAEAMETIRQYLSFVLQKY